MYKSTGLVDKDKEGGSFKNLKNKKPPLRDLLLLLFCAKSNCPRAPCNRRQIASQDKKNLQKIFFIVKFEKLVLKYYCPSGPSLSIICCTALTSSVICLAAGKAIGGRVFANSFHPSPPMKFSASTLAVVSLILLSLRAMTISSRRP